MKSPALAVWASPRLLWSIALCAGLFAFGGLSRALLLLAMLLSVALVVASVVDAMLGPPQNRVLVSRHSPQNFALRVPAKLQYAIENHGSQPVRVGILEAALPKLEYAAQEVRCNVDPLHRTEAELDVVPVDRGDVRLQTLYCWYENRIGLLRRRIILDAPLQVRVYPDLSAVSRYGSLHVRNKLIESGLRKMRLRGVGTEFESLREWASGDPFRSINWKATARRGKLMVAQHEVERSQQIMIVLDCGRLMTARVEGMRKLDFAVTAALSLANIAALASDKLGFLGFARRILVAAPPRPAKIAVRDGAELLYDLAPLFEEADYDRAFLYLRSHLHKRTLIVLFTDMFDPVAAANVLAQLRTLAKRHLVCCVFMNDAAITQALEREPVDVIDVYRGGVAAALAEERRTAAALLASMGVQIVDVPASQLSVALIDRYLQIKERGLL